MSLWAARNTSIEPVMWFLKGSVVVKRYFSNINKKSYKFGKNLVMLERFTDAEFFSEIKGKPQINYLYDDNDSRYLSSYQLGGCKHEWVINFIENSTAYCSIGWGTLEGEGVLELIDYDLADSLTPRVKRNELMELYYEGGKDPNDEDFFEWMLQHDWQLYYTDFEFTGNLLMEDEYLTLKNAPPIVPRRSGYGKL